MGQLYEVQFAKQLEGSDQYGNVTYSVKFTTEDQSVLWRVAPKNAPEAGQKVFGRIEQKVSQNGKDYFVFKREQQENFSQDSGGGYQGQSAKGVGFALSKDDRSDGMRQGMCINNAAAHIAALVRVGIYTNSNPQLWAFDVMSYARELYKLDLSEDAEQSGRTIASDEPQTLALEDINGLFPGAQPVNGMGPQ